MPERNPQNLNVYWAANLVRALFQLGLREVVISPGSRSTPLTLAFAAHPGFRKHIAIDERSGGFLAMGLGKATGIPACLVCTSGTAVANYFPAVIEASQSGIPMIVLSADRPPHLRGIGASQTIDQVKIFGDYPVFFHEAGEPKNHTEALQRLRLAARQAVELAVTKPGVSHINLAFSKPFEPTAEYLEALEKANEKDSRGSFQTPLPPEHITHLNHKLLTRISSAEFPVIIAGSSLRGKLPSTIVELAKKLNAPVLVEPGSNIANSKHTITGFDGFLRNPDIAAQLKPDLILRFGRDPISKALAQYIQRYAEVEQIRFFQGHHPTDESLTAPQFIQIGLDIHLEGINPTSEHKEWMQHWRRIQKKFSTFREAQMYPSSPLTDGYIFYQLSSLIPKNAFTMLSNSFPVRDMALFGNYDGKEIYVNRGTAGIDGILSTTIGLSLSLDKAGVLFIGDIAFLHDSNALMNLKGLNQPLLIFVLNNGGGSIFKMLPIHAFRRKYAHYFETPHQVSLASLCKAHKIPYTLLTRAEQVIPVFEKNIEVGGAHIFECITDSEDSMELRRILWNYNPKNQ